MAVNVTDLQDQYCYSRYCEQCMLKYVVAAIVFVCKGFTAELADPSDDHAEAAGAQIVVPQARKSLCRMKL